MLMNISEIKRRVGQVIDDGSITNFSTKTIRPSPESSQTAENVARRLFVEAAPLFQDSPAQLIACHLREAAGRSATVYANGDCEANHWFEFSAARQTMSPRLTDPKTSTSSERRLRPLVTATITARG